MTDYTVLLLHGAVIHHWIFVRASSVDRARDRVLGVIGRKGTVLGVFPGHIGPLYASAPHGGDIARTLIHFPDEVLEELP